TGSAPVDRDETDPRKMKGLFGNGAPLEKRRGSWLRSALRRTGPPGRRVQPRNQGADGRRARGDHYRVPSANHDLVVKAAVAESRIRADRKFRVGGGETG